jgi:Toastrack DUF4097
VRPAKVALLVAILAVGGAVESAYRIREHIGDGSFGWIDFGGRFHGPSFSYESERATDIEEGTRISVDNAFGDVEVGAGRPGAVDVKLRKVIFLPSDALARALADRLVVRTEFANGVLRVTTNRAEIEGEFQSPAPFRLSAGPGIQTHLSLGVPPGTEILVSNEHGDVNVAEVGDVSVTGTHGDVRVRHVSRDAKIKWSHGDVATDHVGGSLELGSSHGDVEALDIGGTVHLVQAHGDVVTARTGALNIETQYGDLDARDVGGDLRVRGEHAAVAAQDVAGQADVETSYEDVALTRVGRDAAVKVEHGVVALTDILGAATAQTSYDDAVFEGITGALVARVEHGAVRASRISGGARIKADGDDVSVDGFRGRIEVEAHRGGVRLVPDGPLTSDVSASSSYGDIHLAVPSESRFELHAASDSEDVRIDVPGLVALEQSGRRWVGRLGQGGGVVRLDASHGGVSVEAR